MQDATAVTSTMDQQTPAKPSIQDIVLRVLRIAASTVAIVELLRNQWTGGVLAAMAWLLFTQVERLRSSADERTGNGSN
tara:strand:- start:207 stop:443 length:237 start_codon:yes stop_codon:yes gene_type:complete